MPLFEYVAENDTGEKYTGKMEAATYDTVVSRLESKKLFLVSCTPVDKIYEPDTLSQDKVQAQSKKTSWLTMSLFDNKITRRDLIFLFSELEFLVMSGIPLFEALHSLRLQTQKKIIYNVLTKITQQIEAGQSLSHSLDEFPEHFPLLIRKLVFAGEQTGKLYDALNTIVNTLERDERIIHQIRSTLIYPSMLVLVAVGVLVFMTLFIIPNFITLLEINFEDLPAITYIFIKSIDYINVNFKYIAGVFLLIILILSFYFRSIGKYKLIDIWLLQIPFFSEVYKKIILARFSQTLADMLKNDIPILQALNTAKGVIGNSIIVKKIEQISNDVKHGHKLSDAMRQFSIFPYAMITMVATGEKSGDLSTLLQRLSEYNEKEVNVTLGNFFTILEPVLILFLGTFIAIIATALLLPVLNIANMNL